jgi:hypothetical protein
MFHKFYNILWISIAILSHYIHLAVYYEGQDIQKLFAAFRAGISCKQLLCTRLNSAGCKACFYKCTFSVLCCIVVWSIWCYLELPWTQQVLQRCFIKIQVVGGQNACHCSKVVQETCGRGGRLTLLRQDVCVSFQLLSCFERHVSILLWYGMTEILVHRPLASLCDICFDFAYPRFWWSSVACATEHVFRAVSHDT